MKYLTASLLVTIGIGSGVILGVLFHVRILSALDDIQPLDASHGAYEKQVMLDGVDGTMHGTRRDWPEDSLMPDGFTITPKTADFIYSSILNNSWHWGVSAGAWIYHDDESYYFLGHMPELDYDPQQGSYYVKLLGTRIHGRTGAVYSHTLDEWKGQGYCHVQKRDVADIIVHGMQSEAVMEAVGYGFQYRTQWDTNSIPETKTTTAHYWCSDGEVLVMFTNDAVSEVRTNVSISRP